MIYLVFSLRSILGFSAAPIAMVADYNTGTGTGSVERRPEVRLECDFFVFHSRGLLTYSTRATTILHTTASVPQEVVLPWFCLGDGNYTALKTLFVLFKQKFKSREQKMSSSQVGTVLD